MADGEIGVTGVEASGDVRVRVDLMKGRKIDWPRLETADEYMVICSAATLDEAVQLCVDQMLDEVIERTGLPLNEAGMLMSIVGQTQICQVVDPLKTARMVVPKWALEKRS
jgi:amidase